jgi:hypothetical protein
MSTTVAEAPKHTFLERLLVRRQGHLPGRQASPVATEQQYVGGSVEPVYVGPPAAAQPLPLSAQITAAGAVQSFKSWPRAGVSAWELP